MRRQPTAQTEKIQSRTAWRGPLRHRVKFGSRRSGMIVHMRAWGWALICSMVITACISRESRAEDFYSGKQIRIIVGSNPGGGYDAYARLLASNINRFIPGNPTIIVQNMAGADALIATNY